MSAEALDVLKRLFSEIDGLIGASEGVTGYHLNGKVAFWEDLAPGGKFECLPSLIDAMAVIEKYSKCANRSPWLPMDKAPKDGTNVLLKIIPGADPVIGHWSNDEYSKKPRPYWTNSGEVIFGRRHVRERQPVGWMPLPKTTAEAEGEQ